MRKLYSMRAYLTLCILAISTLIGGVSAQAQEAEQPYKTLLFGKNYNSQSVQNYTTAWNATVNNFTWDIVNFNNNQNSWNYVKCGRKNYASIATITTQSAIDKSISKVVITVDAITATAINSTTLTVATDKDFTENVQTQNITLAKGDITCTIDTPQANSYYKLTFDCKSASSNGPLQISKVEYYAAEEEVGDKTIAEIQFPSAPYSMNLGEELTIEATTNSDAPITYSSSNEAIAAIDINTGKITAYQEGSVTITAEVIATENFTKASNTCELTITDPRTAPEFSFSEESYTINVNEAKKILPTTNSNGEISYASSNDAVATVDAEGNVKGIAEGDATITATIAATNEYKPATATYQIKVVDPNKPAEVVTPMSFKKVTSTDELIEGGQYIIVCEDQNVAMTTISSKNKGETASIEITDEATNAAELPNNVTIYTISNKDSDGFFNLINGGNFLSSAGSSTDIKENATADNNSKWKLDATNGIVCKSTTTRAILLSTAANPAVFGNYAVQNLGKNYYKAQLYRLETSTTINEKIGYTTFYTDKVYQLADGMTAYTINESDEAGKVNAIEAYAAGEDVPANTALLLGGEAGTYRLPVLNKEVAAYEGENLLEGKRMGNGMTRSDRENVLYYKLTTLNGENPGFYWGAEEGAAFIMKNPTTAYLAVDKAVAGANGLRLVIGESGTTGIGTVTETTQNGAIYTISGVRVNAGSTAGLPKGIYIVNGKKLLVK